MNHTDLLQQAADTIEAMWDPHAGGKLNIDAASSSFMHRAQFTLAALRAALAQPGPTGNAPCARHCEATAFQSEIRRLEFELRTATPQPDPVVPADMVMVPMEIVDRFPEINPSNYDHDDACALNSWGVELVLAAAPVVREPLTDEQADAISGALFGCRNAAYRQQIKDALRNITGDSK